MFFLAHCWELFFTFYLAVRLVWPKIRVDYFLPCTWASEKLSHGWQSIIFFSYTWVFSNVGPQFAVKLCFFFTWASHFRQNWKPLFCVHAFGPFISSLQNSQNHMVLPWLYLLSWANLCPWLQTNICFVKHWAGCMGWSCHGGILHSNVENIWALFGLENNAVATKEYIVFKKWSHSVVITYVAY